MAADWSRLADFIRSEMGRKRWSQRDLARESGVSERTISDLLSGRPRKWLPRTMAQIEIALGWGAGRTSDILAGGDERPRKRQMAPAEFRTLLDLMRERLDRATFAADDRDRLRARIDELEADIEGTAGEHQAC